MCWNQSVDNFIDSIILFSNKFCPRITLFSFSMPMTYVCWRRFSPSWTTIFWGKSGWNGLWSIVFSRQVARTIYRSYSIFYVFTFFSFFSSHFNMVTFASPSDFCEHGYNASESPKSQYRKQPLISFPILSSKESM